MTRSLLATFCLLVTPFWVRGSEAPAPQGQGSASRKGASTQSAQSGGSDPAEKVPVPQGCPGEAAVLDAAARAMAVEAEEVHTVHTVATVLAILLGLAAASSLYNGWQWGRRVRRLQSDIRDLGAARGVLAGELSSIKVQKEAAGDMLRTLQGQSSTLGAITECLIRSGRARLVALQKLSQILDPALGELKAGVVRSDLEPLESRVEAAYALGRYSECPSAAELVPTFVKCLEDVARTKGIPDKLSRQIALSLEKLKVAAASGAR